MTAGRRRVFVPEPLPVAVLQPLLEVADISQGPADRSCTEEELAYQARRHDAFIITSRERITAAVLNAGPRLKSVTKAGARPSNVDFAAAEARNVLVTWTPAANAVSVAEHAIAVMLASVKNIHRLNRKLLDGGWRDFSDLTVELDGKTAGLLGFGAIGVQVARRLCAFGVRVLACDPAVSAAAMQRESVAPATVDDLVGHADILSLHCDLTPATRHIIDAQRLRVMKRTALIVNTARGDLIVEADLLRALDEGWIAGAALDVFTAEPPPRGMPLLAHPRVLATPHVAAFTRESVDREVRWAVDDVVAILAGREPERWMSGMTASSHG